VTDVTKGGCGKLVDADLGMMDGEVKIPILSLERDKDGATARLAQVPRYAKSACSNDIWPQHARKIVSYQSV
jgi:hypothetical protein